MIGLIGGGKKLQEKAGGHAQDRDMQGHKEDKESETQLL